MGVAAYCTSQGSCVRVDAGDARLIRGAMNSFLSPFLSEIVYSVFFPSPGQLVGGEVEWDKSVYIIDQRASEASLLAGLQRVDETVSQGGGRSSCPHLFRPHRLPGKKHQSAPCNIHVTRVRTHVQTHVFQAFALDLFFVAFSHVKAQHAACFI